MEVEAPPLTEYRILILAPTEKDGQISESILSRASLQASIVPDVRTLSAEIERGVGAIVLTEDALASLSLPLLKQTLTRQPSWSEIPVILLLQRGADSPMAFRWLDAFGNVFLLDRPVRLNTLLSALRTAIRGRRRQYELRDELAERRQVEHALRASEKALRRASEELEIKVRERTRDLTLKTEELARSNADLEHFAYVASHDLKEPLRTVSSYTQLLLRRLASHIDGETQEIANYITGGVRRMNSLIEDLLTYARVGRGDLQMTPIDLNLLVEETAQDFSELIESGDVVIEADRLPPIVGDRNQLMQVFQNLLGNSVKFRSTEKVRIAVRGKVEGQRLVVSVKDNGIGIDPQYFERIFVIFQRLHTQADYSGTGIGLSVCKKIIERHGGRIWLESTLGEGTEFFFTLPLASAGQLVGTNGQSH